MSFIIFLLLFIFVCGWLDARIGIQKKKGEQGK
jgi:hypothetical protein